MYTRLITFVVGLSCFVILATVLARALTDAELARREIGTSQQP